LWFRYFAIVIVQARLRRILPYLTAVCLVSLTPDKDKGSAMLKMAGQNPI